MAYVTVRQLNDEDFRRMNDTFGSENQIELAKEVLKRNDYIRVADMVLGGSLQDIRNEAYELTNSIYDVWYSNKDIQVAEQASKGCRSTSTGDIIQVAGESYMVASIGFVYLGDD